jgi:hypothetical protein
MQQQRKDKAQLQSTSFTRNIFCGPKGSNCEEMERKKSLLKNNI